MTQVTSEKMSVERKKPRQNKKRKTTAKSVRKPYRKLEKMSESVPIEAEKNVGEASQKMSGEVYTGALDINAMDTYWLVLEGGREVNVMAPAPEFDQALIDIGFNLIDRAVWPIFHRLLVLEQVPREEDGVKLVQKTPEKMSEDAPKSVGDVSEKMSVKDE